MEILSVVLGVIIAVVIVIVVLGVFLRLRAKYVAHKNHQFYTNMRHQRAINEARRKAGQL